MDKFLKRSFDSSRLLRSVPSFARAIQRHLSPLSSQKWRSSGGTRGILRDPGVAEKRGKRNANAAFIGVAVDISDTRLRLLPQSGETLSREANVKRS